MTESFEKYIEKDLRVDKWLWAVRIFKTRSLAADACRKNQVSVEGVFVKASRIIKENEVVKVKKPPFTYTYRVKGLLGNRLSASLVKDFVEDITPEEEIEKMKMSRISFGIFREKGLGRPTKKERRNLDQMFS